MSSILTNTSAMVALQTLKSINSGLEKTQSEISTGLSISNAKDNSAIWAISKVMESDIMGFKAISDSLALGESTVAVAQTAAETVTDLLTQIKEKIVAATGDNVDHTKLNDDITALKDQITSVVDAAQFNGLNLVNSTTGTTVLSSIDRSGSSITPASITVDAQDLSQGTYTANDVFSTTSTTTTVVSGNGDTFVMTLDDTANDTLEITSPTTAYAEGDSITITVGDQTVTYTVTAEDAAATTPEDIIAVGLKQAIESLGITGLTVDYDAGSTDDQLDITNGTGQDLTITGQWSNAGAGGLGTLDAIDVSGGAVASDLTTIESLIDTAISAAASFGTVGAQIQTQSDFISSLTDSLTAGKGSLVDANMEETSAKLQALQVQQQLGIQSLSIANQAPQNVLALFR